MYPDLSGEHCTVAGSIGAAMRDALVCTLTSQVGTVL